MSLVLLLCLAATSAFAELYSVELHKTPYFFGKFDFQLLHEDAEQTLQTPSLDTNNMNDTFFNLILDLGPDGKITISVSKYQGEYCVWTNMLLEFKGEIAEASPAPKFMTYLKGEYACNSVIDIPMSKNYTLKMANATFRSFTNDEPSYIETCPRDIKVNAPAAALTGAFVGLAIIAIFVAFGGVQCHKRLKAKKAAGQD
ncbi:hypothetical protein AAHC03_01146 [Spirometra sp. Aus1]